MAREFSRNARVAESIKRTLGPLLNTLGRELGLGMATVTAVDVAPDLSQARVFISIFGDDAVQQAGLEKLHPRIYRLRQEIARELRLKKVPLVHLELDRGGARSSRIAELLDDSTMGAKRPH